MFVLWKFEYSSTLRSSLMQICRLEPSLKWVQAASFRGKTQERGLVNSTTPTMIQHKANKPDLRRRRPNCKFVDQWVTWLNFWHEWLMHRDLENHQIFVPFPELLPVSFKANCALWLKLHARDFKKDVESCVWWLAQRCFWNFHAYAIELINDESRISLI